MKEEEHQCYTCGFPCLDLLKLSIEKSHGYDLHCLVVPILAHIEATLTFKGRQEALTLVGATIKVLQKGLVAIFQEEREDFDALYTEGFNC